MPRPPETPDIRASKTLAYILRHGAEKERLHIRSDGFLRLGDVLARPKLRDVDLEMVLRLVRENAKQRFEVVWGYDLSPPRLKKGQGQGKGKGKGKGKGIDTGTVVLEQPVGEEQDGKPAEEAQVEDVQQQLSKSSISAITEIPLIILPEGETEDGKGEWWIRATQGHSIQLDSVSHLEEVKDDEDGRTRVGLMVHGTRWEIWDILKEKGLSRMTRQHIHLAPALVTEEHRITPRANSTLLIYLDLSKMLQAGIPVYTSLNGVILTPGNREGIVGKEYWKKVERVVKGAKVVIWEDGKEILQLAGEMSAQPKNDPVVGTNE